MYQALPADEISQRLLIASNLLGALYIACTEPSWAGGTAIMVAANIVPLIEAAVTGTANRCLTGNRYWAGLTAIQWDWKSNWGTFFYYPTISPNCMSYQTARTIVEATKPLRNN